MNGLLANPVISGLLGGGPNAIRAAAEQQRMALAPRGGGGMSGAPGAIVTQDRSGADLGAGLAGLGQGLSAIGKMRADAKQQEAEDQAISQYLGQIQDPARKAQLEALAKSGGKGREFLLKGVYGQAFPETAEPMKPVVLAEGSALVDPETGKRIAEGPAKVREPEKVRLWFGERHVDVVPGSDMERRYIGAGFKEAPTIAPPAPRNVQTVTTAQGVFVLQPNGELGRKLGGPPSRPQDDLAAFKLEQEQGTAQRLVVSQYEDLDNLIKQGDIVLNHPGREKGTGMSRALFSPFGITIPGTDVSGFAAQLETLKAKVFLPEVQKMQGMGALSNAEGQKISAAFAALDPNMPDDEFKSTLKSALDRLEAARERAKSRLPADYKGVEAAVESDADSPPEGFDPSLWEFMSPEERALFK
jgi:hypothetical protein